MLYKTSISKFESEEVNNNQYFHNHRFLVIFQTKTLSALAITFLSSIKSAM